MTLGDGFVLLGFSAILQALLVNYYFAKKRKYMRDFLNQFNDGELS